VPLSPLSKLTLTATVASLLWLTSSGCILLVGGGGLETTTCQFQGNDTTCGSCIAAHCQTEVNACCLDSTCDGNLGYLDGCASSGDAVSCAYLTSGSLLVPSAKFGSLSQCVTRECSTCGTGSTSSFDSGLGPPGIGCTVETDSCFCTNSATASGKGVTCDPTTIENSVCCASYGWPASDAGAGVLQPVCSCTKVGCTVSADICSCSANADATEDGDLASCSPSFGPCYVSDGLCSCLADASSGAFGTPVKDCSPPNTGCYNNYTQVKSCSTP
jgi:hypothetical protein